MVTVAMLYSILSDSGTLGMAVQIKIVLLKVCCPGFMREVNSFGLRHQNMDGCCSRVGIFETLPKS